MDSLTELVNAKLPEGARPIRSLANPGEINQEVAEIIARDLPTEEVVGVIRKLLKAKRKTKYGEEDDIRAMEAGAKLALAYKVGLPIQRQQIEMRQTNNDSEVVMRLLEIPAMRSALRKALDDAENVSKKEA